MTQPTPAPSTGNPLLDALNAQVDSKSKTAKKQGNLYGLADWGSQQVNPGNLPITVNLAAGAQQTTGDAIVQSFAHSRPDQIATIQHALYMAGGYYTGSHTPNWGVLTADDVAAFAKAVKTAGQAGQPVSDLLSTQARAGAQMGVAAAQQRAQTQAKVATVTLPNTQDLEAEADAAFQKIVGHKASPEQAARFAAFYRGMAAGQQRAAAQQEYDATNPTLPDALTQADPARLTQDATSVITHGTQLAPATGQANSHDPDTWKMQQTSNVGPGDFSQQIGGLMSLGQAVAAAQQQPGSAGGLSFVTQDSLPSASTAAENYARNSDPKGAAANDTANTFNTFLSLLSRSFG